MPSSKPLSNKSFFWLSGAIIVGFVVVAWCAAPVVEAYAQRRATTFALAATQTGDESQRVDDLQLASALDPGNVSYRTQLADHFEQRGQLQAAVNALGSTVGERVRKAGLLRQLGEYQQGLDVLMGLSGSDVSVARSQLYLEEGSGARAIAAAKGAGSDAALMQLGLCYGTTGKSSLILAVTTRIHSQTAREQAVLAQGGGLALAEALYASKMYASAQRVLQTSTSASAASYELLAHAYLAQPITHGRLLGAQSAATQAAGLQPSDLTAHHLLEYIDSQLKDQAGEATERGLIHQLQLGNP